MSEHAFKTSSSVTGGDTVFSLMPILASAQREHSFLCNFVMIQLKSWSSLHTFFFMAKWLFLHCYIFGGRRCFKIVLISNVFT